MGVRASATGSPSRRMACCAISKALSVTGKGLQEGPFLLKDALVGVMGEGRGHSIHAGLGSPGIDKVVHRKDASPLLRCPADGIKGELEEDAPAVSGGEREAAVKPLGSDGLVRFEACTRA